eukprot:scaffold14168_cov64-Phaeocystis_antarctica.AAC.7
MYGSPSLRRMRVASSIWCLACVNFDLVTSCPSDIKVNSATSTDGKTSHCGFIGHVACCKEPPLSGSVHAASKVLLKSRGAEDAGTNVGAGAVVGVDAGVDAGASASAAVRSCTLQRGSGEPTGMLPLGRLGSAVVCCSWAARSAALDP